LLVNLRNPEDNYTNYSFPPELFEYIASCIFIITTKPDGIPDEYYDYLYIVESYELDVIKNKIVEICKKTKKNYVSLT